MATSLATSRLRWQPAMQLNSHQHRRGREYKAVRYLLTDLCAIGFSDWARSAGRPCRRMLLVPSLWSQRRGVRLNPLR